MTDTDYTGTSLNSQINELEKKLRLETERADRNYEVAAFFEKLYEEAIDWKISEQDVE